MFLNRQFVGDIRALSRHPGFRRYASNSGWLIAEQFLRGIAGICVGIYVARYLGPEKFGTFSYITSVVAIFAAIARLGFDGVIVRELVSEPPTQHAVDLGTAFWMMLIAAVVCLGLLLGSVALLDPDPQHSLFALLAAGGLIFQSFGIVDWFCQARVQSRIAASCRVITLGLSSVARVVVVVLQYDLTALFAIAFVEQASLAALYWIVARRSGMPNCLAKFSLGRARKFLGDSWPLILTALAVTFYMRLDQVMIKAMLGETQVGVYSAAVKVYEAWSMIPYLLSMSLLPAIVRSRALGEKIYQQRLVYLFRTVFWASAVVATFVAIFARPIISYGFGPAYHEASGVLGIVMLTAVWAALGSGSVRYFIAEGMERKIAVRTLVAAGVNFLLNLLLIPRMGIQGAAVATLSCLFIANYLMDWLDRDLRPLLAIKHRAIFFVAVKQ